MVFFATDPVFDTSHEVSKNSNFQPNVLKQEMHDPEFDAMESSMASPSKRTTKNSSTAASASTTPVSKWTDRQLKRQLGLTREDLNRYA